MPLECPPRRHFSSVEDAFAAWAECLVVTCPACGTNVYPSSPPKLLNSPPILMLNLQGAHLSCNMATAVVDVPSTAPNDVRFDLDQEWHEPFLISSVTVPALPAQGCR